MKGVTQRSFTAHLEASCYHHGAAVTFASRLQVSNNQYCGALEGFPVTNFVHSRELSTESAVRYSQKLHSYDKGPLYCGRPITII